MADQEHAERDQSGRHPSGPRSAGYTPAMSRRLVPIFALAVAGPSIAPSTANAANGLRPRTPAEFSAVPCVQTVTRGEVLHIDYAVAYDDTELTPDELLDSRKHQFFAYSKTTFDFAFPVWINRADFDRAEANGDITVSFDDNDILEVSADWPADTWVRITADDPRLPITEAQAAMGVDWDTTDVAPGTWVVAAYTWEPENNLWSPRFGAVRIVDPADPDATGPTAFLPRVDGLLVDRAEGITIEGCVEAPEGSTITASWGTISTGQGEPQWVPFVEDREVESGPLALDLMPPDESGSTIKVRLEITDPNGRTYVAYSPAVIGVTGEAPPPAKGGCACANERPSPWTATVGLLGLLVLGVRRRRSMTDARPRA